MTKSKLCDYYRADHKDGLIIWYENDNEEIVCTVSITEYEGQMWIGALYVSPLYRRKGLCRELLDYATFNGGNHLAVRKTNKPAIIAYSRYGFKKYDEDKTNYYMAIHR